MNAKQTPDIGPERRHEVGAQDALLGFRTPLSQAL